MPQLVEIRKLVAVDMVLHGTRFIIGEFAVGVILPACLGVLTLFANSASATPSRWQLIVGPWLLGIAVNYIPLLAYAISLARARAALAEGTPELLHVRNYSIQQFIIFIPCLVAVIALAQEYSRRVPTH